MRKLMIWVLVLLMAFFGAACSGAGKVNPETKTELITQTKSMVQDLAQGRYEESFSNYPYTFAMKMAYNAKGAQTLWEGWVKSYGDFDEIYGEEWDDSTNTAVLKLHFQYECIDLLVAYEGKSIAGIHYADNDDIVTFEEPWTSSYRTEEVTFGEEWSLTGTLTYPDVPEGTAVPIVILVADSGIINRDGRILSQKPYRDIAEDLAAQGVASFRYDKRTYAYQSQLATDESLTVWDETINDAVLAVQAMQAKGGFSKFILAGHGLGAMLMPRIYENTTNVNGVIMMAAPALPLQNEIVAQSNYLFNLDGIIDANERSVLSTMNTMSQNVQAVAVGTKYDAKDLFGIPYAYWKDLSDYNVVELAKNINIPMMFLQGQGDYQVPATDLEYFRESLQDRQDVSFTVYEDLGHLFTKAGDPPSPDDYKMKETVPMKVAQDMANFIHGIS